MDCHRLKLCSKAFRSGTDPKTCLLALGPRGGRPHGDGCDLMKPVKREERAWEGFPGLSAAPRRTQELLPVVPWKAEEEESLHCGAGNHQAFPYLFL